MKALVDVVNRAPRPAPWSEGENIPWNDPGFSERMLTEHLSQEHDLVSRRSATIEEHVDWIFATVLGGRPGRVLDLGCGPGLYANRLAARACECVGGDFSPASIRHAREAAAAGGLPCRFIEADLRDAAFGDGFDLVMMIFGQLTASRGNGRRRSSPGPAPRRGGTSLSPWIDPRRHTVAESPGGERRPRTGGRTCDSSEVRFVECKGVKLGPGGGPLRAS